MFKINPLYDVILTYSPIIEITGHIFECFDYYLFLKEYYKVGILFFNGLNLDKLKTIFESKYNYDFNLIKKDLIQITNISNLSNKQIIFFGKNTKVILADGNIKALEYYNIYLATNKLYGFMCEYENFHEVKLNTKITYLQDYRIYGENKYFKSINYIKKIPFKYYKKSISPNKNIGMMYITYVCRKITPDIIQKYHILSKCDKTILVVPYKLPEYDLIPNVVQTIAPIKNFFNVFDTYIYTPINRKFDCSPRLITECFLHNKKIYKNLDYFDIGLETRYNDCITNLNKLDLTENDEILNILK